MGYKSNGLGSEGEKKEKGKSLHFISHSPLAIFKSPVQSIVQLVNISVAFCYSSTFRAIISKSGFSGKQPEAKSIPY